VIDKLDADVCSRLTLLGGEPLTHPNITTIVERLVQKKLKLRIVTNGLLLTDELVRLFNKSQLLDIVISLDGPDSVSHDILRGNRTFESVIRNIKNLASVFRDSDNFIGISSTLYNETIFRIKDFIELACDLNVNALYLSGLERYGNADLNYGDIGISLDNYNAAALAFFSEYGFKDQYNNGKLKVFYNFLNTSLRAYLNYNGVVNSIPYTPCPAASDLGSIDSQGNLWPCMVFHGNLELKQVLPDFFHINDNSLVDNPIQAIWESWGFRKIRQLKERNLHYQFGNPCHRCKFAHLCSPCFLPYILGKSFNGPECIKRLSAIDKINDN
jgi:MoaA/NifB/PqqE/SkfB family radical SAM enzyme